MQYSMELKPYNEFWMNCILNSAFTIAIHKDPSYRYAAYMNNYHYKVWGAAIDPLFKSPTINVLNYEKKWRKFVLKQVIKKETSYKFRDKEKFLTELHELIDKKQLFRINVDLFYWLPNNVAWNKFHMSHYSIIQGYDPETKMYQVLDDDTNGYGTHLIPEERLITAFNNSDAMVYPSYKRPHVYIYHLQKQVEPYRLSIDEVSRNAERLVVELDSFTFDNLWDIKDMVKFNDYIDISLIGINIISSRHKGNEFLFQSLYEFNLIDEVVHKDLETSIKKIQNGWKSIKFIFISKTISEDKNIDLELIRTKATQLIGDEKKMWLSFINYTR
ncbi:hypothetical protein [Paenibacillus glacialis]|uniref:Butirosin biosynthesis protein H N-terminal domain-containing protein n=1 Tax=Paenibacillus glacialis TaxID=494026 RepID=A0A168MAG7_9BACL|nr:hypothetical protein [Paenibacillus glacialis]OAB44438.1 hypothetical protein PGLA_07225 [Paenibacillus glacialis]